MLKKVRIKNFFSCEDTEIDFDNVTALIGRNAAGKTNILKTVLWISWFILGDQEVSIALEKETEIFIDFLINGNKFKYVISKFSHLDGCTELFYKYINNEWVVIVDRKAKKAIYDNGQEKIEFNVNSFTSAIKSILTFSPEDKISPDIGDFKQYLTEINYYKLENVEPTVGCNQVSAKKYQDWLFTKEIKSHNDVSPLMRLLDAWIKDRETFDEVQSLLGKNGLDLIDNIVIDDKNYNDTEEYNPEYHRYFIYFYVKNIDKKTALNFLSFGTQRVLMILLALLYDKNSTLLIEQPEDGIHLGLLRKVLSICFTYAKAYNKQLIITTHSPEVIDMFQPENVRFVKMTEQGTKVSKLDNDLLAVIPEYLENEGTLSDFIAFMDDE